MNTIILQKEKLYTGNLLLVNAGFPVRYLCEEGLVPADTRFPHILIRREAANVLQQVIKKIGCLDEIIPVSGYRSAGEQSNIYSNSLNENGKSFTEKFVALPKHSEHHTGLAIDLGLKKDTVDFICPDFPYYGICDEFRKAAVQYGFIERYRKNKEKITGIAHEPWHFRYVGYPHSEIISENNLSLEEYIEYIRDFQHDRKPLQIQKDGKRIEIYYVPFDASEAVSVSIPEQAVYQVSGNNIDGFIVTLWRHVK
nr:M15 family metallopeptidase [Ruminiclostridium sufflavum]